MKLEDQVISLESAKLLKSLGVLQESFFHWMDDGYGHIHVHIGGWDNGRDSIASAFTCAELGEMLPRNMVKTLKWFNNWYCEAFKDVAEHTGPIVRKVAKTEAEARAKCLIYLLENHFISNKRKR